MFGLLAVLSDCGQSNRICCMSSSKVHFKMITSFIVLSHNQICIFLSSCLRSSHFFIDNYTSIASMFYEDEDCVIYNYTEISFWHSVFFTTTLHTFWWFTFFSCLSSALKKFDKPCKESVAGGRIPFTSWCQHLCLHSGS